MKTQTGKQINQSYLRKTLLSQHLPQRGLPGDYNKQKHMAR